MLLFSLSTNILMNASISIAMTAPKLVIMFVTVSIAMFVETIIQQSLTEARDYGSHFMAIGCFLFPIWQPQVQPATTNCFVASESVAVPRNPFSSLGVTFITPPYTHHTQSIWPHDQMAWGNKFIFMQTKSWHIDLCISNLPMGHYLVM